MKLRNVALSLAVMAALPAGYAAAASSSVQQQIDALQKALAEQQAQLEAQKKQIQQQEAQLGTLRAAEKAAPPADQGTVAHLQSDVQSLKQAADKSKDAAKDSPRWTFNNGRPTITSADGRNSLSIRGIFQADAAHYDQDPLGPLGTDYRRGSTGATANREINAARDLSDGAYFRRARIGVEGTFAKDFTYRFITEFAGSGTEGPARINDAWVGYNGFGSVSIVGGAFSPPANLDDGTSPEDLVFIERASASEMSRALGGGDGRLGVGLRTTGPRWFGALTLTSRTVNDAEVFDSQTAAVGRAGFLLATSEDYNLHIGGAGTYVIHPPDQGADAGGARYGIRFRERPELRVDDARLIDTGTIDADHAYVASAELAGNWRNFYLQGENYWFGIERRTPAKLEDPKFKGYYVQGSWVITGESHRYNMATASYQNPRPAHPFSHAGGWGAWELAARYSHTDLDFDPGSPGSASKGSAVRGGVQNISTVGVNWYLTPNFKLLFDYQHVQVSRLNPASLTSLPFGPAPSTPPVGVQIGQDYNAYALRTQFSF